VTEQTQAQIDSIVQNNDVVLFMKGTMNFPQCGFSSGVAQLLQFLQIEAQDVNVLESDELRQGIKDYSNWPTIPQLYVKGEFVGGFDIVKEMFESGEFFGMLEDKAISYKRPAASE
jgi:monothiol glutaredoxin